MGCASSKRIDATAPVYHPPPTSFAVFDINAIEEPWLKHLNNTATDPLHTQDAKPSLPAPILHLLENATEAPQSWDEVSKVLHDLKPIVEQPPQPPQPQPPSTPPPQNAPQPPRKVASFHTLEELDAKLTPNSKPGLRKSLTEIGKNKNEAVEEEENQNRIKIKPSSKLKDNIFIVRDRQERKKDESESVYERLRRDPLSQFPEKCPPGGGDAVVIYTTSLRGVRKTFEDCNRAREVLEGHRVVVDERDVALHSGFLREVKELLAEEVVASAPLPRVFVKGRYLGGLEELVELNESGRLGRILSATRVERGVGRLGCEGCGGARFVPCLDCGGSCKLVVSDVNDKERCPKCNENGLVHCPACA